MEEWPDLQEAGWISHLQPRLSSRSSSLWVYVFDESDEESPPPYLAKTPIPLSGLSTGREVKGEGRSTQEKSQRCSFSEST